MRVQEGLSASRRNQLHHCLPVGDDDVVGEKEVGLARSDTRAVQRRCALRHAKMDENAAAFLRHAQHVDRGGCAAVQMRRHSQNGGERRDPLPADPGENHIIGLIGKPWRGYLWRGGTNARVAVLGPPALRQ